MPFAASRAFFPLRPPDRFPSTAEVSISAALSFAKANPNLVFKAALIEGRAVPAAEIKAIAELPSREEMVARLLFLMQSPMRRLVTVLNGPVRNLAGVVSQIADQKAKSGPAPAAAPEN